jgi:hypothetical protein
MPGVTRKDLSSVTSFDTHCSLNTGRLKESERCQKEVRGKPKFFRKYQVYYKIDVVIQRTYIN